MCRDRIVCGRAGPRERWRIDRESAVISGWQSTEQSAAHVGGRDWRRTVTTGGREWRLRFTTSSLYPSTPSDRITAVPTRFVCWFYGKARRNRCVLSSDDGTSVVRPHHVNAIRTVHTATARYVYYCKAVYGACAIPWIGGRRTREYCTDVDGDAETEHLSTYTHVFASPKIEHTAPAACGGRSE